MIIIVTNWFPMNKSIEVGEKFFKLAGQPLPPVIKKWETYATDDGLNGGKGYHIIKTEKDKGDEAIDLIRQLMAPMATIEGFTFKTEILYGMKEAARLMKFMK